MEAKAWRGEGRRGRVIESDNCDRSILASNGNDMLNFLRGWARLGARKESDGKGIGGFDTSVQAFAQCNEAEWRKVGDFEEEKFSSCAVCLDLEEEDQVRSQEADGAEFRPGFGFSKSVRMRCSMNELRSRYLIAPWRTYAQIDVVICAICNSMLSIFDMDDIYVRGLDALSKLQPASDIDTPELRPCRIEHHYFTLRGKSRSDCPEPNVFIHTWPR